MALADNSNGMVMPVSPMYGENNGMGFGGDWFAWIVLLLLVGFNGNGFGFGNNGGELYPWLNQSENTFSGFQNLSTQLANGFASIQQSMSSNQMANMQQQFAGQTAMMQGFNQIGTQVANGFCGTNTGIADLKYTVAVENCNDRAASAQNTRDIIDSQTRGTQAILDKLCQLELDGVKAQVDAKNDRIVELQNQLNMANLSASQIAQDQRIVDNIYNRLSTCPVGTTPVYGRTPIFSCNGGCGCSGNNTLV